MKIQLFSILCVLFILNNAFATEQEKSLLVLEGRHIYTYDLPKLNEAFPDIKFPKFLGLRQIIIRAIKLHGQHLINSYI